METLGLTYISSFTTFLDFHLGQPGTTQPVGNYSAGASCQHMAVTVWIATDNRILPRRGASVIPAKAGVQSHSLDSGESRNDEFGRYGSDLTGAASGLPAFKKMPAANWFAPEA